MGCKLVLKAAIELLQMCASVTTKPLQRALWPHGSEGLSQYYRTLKKTMIPNVSSRAQLSRTCWASSVRNRKAKNNVQVPTENTVS